jgi:hypothetical protein
VNICCAFLQFVPSVRSTRDGLVGGSCEAGQLQGPRRIFWTERWAHTFFLTSESSLESVDSLQDLSLLGRHLECVKEPEECGSRKVASRESGEVPVQKRAERIAHLRNSLALVLAYGRFRVRVITGMT